MISKVCDTPSRNDFSSETLEIMANEIYTNIEQDIDVVNINVNTSSAKEAEYNKNENLSRNSNMKVTKSDTKNEETRQGCCGNPMLKDLIKIMIIQQLLQGNKPPRPPRPPHPPMPGPGPMPPRPPRPPYRGLENLSYMAIITALVNHIHIIIINLKLKRYTKICLYIFFYITQNKNSKQKCLLILCMVCKQ